MGGVYLTVLYLQRLEKLRTGENFSPIGQRMKNSFLVGQKVHTPQKSARAYFYFIPSANRERELGMHIAFLNKTKQIEIQTNATCACTFL